MNNQSVLNEYLRIVVDDLDFNTSFRHVKYDLEYDFIQLPVELVIFESNFDDQIKYLTETIKQNKYTVKSLRKIWIPKQNFLLRPGSIPHLDDRVVFQALVDKIAPILEAQLPSIGDEVVFSSRLNSDNKSDSMLLHPRDQWNGFNNKSIELCNKSTYALVSDIASYFESIDLTQLHDTLTSSGADPNYVNAIHYMLLIWADGRTQGIPQMLAPCSFLANVYLSQVDKVMDRLGYKYIRYVDDLRIFVPSEVSGRQALLHLSEQLKRCYLDAQASKTKLLQATELKDHLTALDRHLRKVGIHTEDKLSYFGDSEPDQEIPENKLLAFLESLMRNPDYDDRHLRFCVNHLGNIGSPGALRKVLDELENMPQEAATFAQYLLKLKPSEFTEQIIDRLIHFFESEYCIYDWQMMWLLIVLAKCEKINSSQLKRLSRIERLHQHYICRAWLSYLLCSKGDLSFKREYMSLYQQERSKEVLMAILCGISGLDKVERNNFYALAQGKDRDLDQLIEILTENHNVSVYLLAACSIDSIARNETKQIQQKPQQILDVDDFSLSEQRKMFTNELNQHQRNLAKLRQKKAFYAAGEEPLSLLNQIEAEEQEITFLEAKLVELSDDKSRT